MHIGSDWKVEQKDRNNKNPIKVPELKKKKSIVKQTMNAFNTFISRVNTVQERFINRNYSNYNTEIKVSEEKTQQNIQD